MVTDILQKPKKVEPKKVDAAPQPEPRPVKKPSPAKKKEPAVLKHLAREPGAAIPIDVAFDGESLTASPAKAGGYKHVVKLDAPNPFSLVKTVRSASSPNCNIRLG